MESPEVLISNLPEVESPNYRKNQFTGNAEMNHRKCRNRITGSAELESELHE